ISPSTFILDCSVPADHDEASGSRMIPSSQNQAVAFRTTHWSVVLEAQGSTPAAHAALEELCRTYWRPIYGFVRREGTKPEEAKDITQGFFALILERRDFQSVRQEKGRLRSFLLASLKPFIDCDSVIASCCVKKWRTRWQRRPRSKTNCATSSPRCAHNLLGISVHYLSGRNGRAMRITTGKKFCRKCGAAIPPNSPQQSCGACLLETGLSPDEPIARVGLSAVASAKADDPRPMPM